MNSKDLYDAIGKMDDDILEKSEAPAKAGSRKRRRLVWGAVAACVCLVIAGAVMRRQLRPPYTSMAGITWSDNGVTIPPIEVSLPSGGTADMIGFFIYQGRLYVQYEPVEDTGELVGEYLGTTVGSIDEWTTEEGYVDFAGSIHGDVYTVQGYDPAFILCMKWTDSVWTFICNNGITLKYGSELYEDRLQLSGHIASAEYESDDSWFYGLGERYRLDSADRTVLNFIRELDAARFMPADAVPLDGGQDSVADTELYHLVFRLDNGLPVHLRLHENGYVRLQGMWDVCVQVPEKRYRPLLELLDSRAGSVVAGTAEAYGPTLEECRNDAELGRYVPAYVPEDMRLTYADIYRYLDDQTGEETGTKTIWLEYVSSENPRHFYSITVTWAEEFGKNGWEGPMIDAADLRLEWISEYFKPESSEGDSVSESSLDAGVWYGNVSVVISAHGVSPETAYEILRSGQ